MRTTFEFDETSCPNRTKRPSIWPLKTYRLIDWGDNKPLIVCKKCGLRLEEKEISNEQDRLGLKDQFVPHP